MSKWIHVLKTSKWANLCFDRDFSLRRRKSGSFWSRMKRKNSSSPKTPLPSKSTHPANEQLNAEAKRNKNLRECRWPTKWKYHEISDMPQIPLKMPREFSSLSWGFLHGYTWIMCIYLYIYISIYLYIYISIYLYVRAISSKHVGTYYHFAKEKTTGVDQTCMFMQQILYQATCSSQQPSSTTRWLIFPPNTASSLHFHVAVEKRNISCASSIKPPRPNLKPPGIFVALLTRLPTTGLKTKVG